MMTAPSKHTFETLDLGRRGLPCCGGKARRLYTHYGSPMARFRLSSRTSMAKARYSRHNFCLGRRWFQA